MPDEKMDMPEIGIEDTFKMIDETIEQLEDGDLPLEESFVAYKKGMELIKMAAAKIDAVEKKVIEISNTGEINEFE